MIFLKTIGQSLAISLCWMVLTGTPTELLAQRKPVLSTRPTPAKDIDTRTRLKVEGWVRQAFDEYLNNAKLYDGKPDTGVTWFKKLLWKPKVSAASIDRFKNLFHLSAEVMDDLSLKQPAGQMNNSDFASKVYEHLSERTLGSKCGYRFEIISAAIDNIRFDSAGFYIVEVALTKKVYSRVTERSGEHIGEYESVGRCFEQVFKYDVPASLKEKALLLSITGHLVSANNCKAMLLRPDEPDETWANAAAPYKKPSTAVDLPAQPVRTTYPNRRANQFLCKI